MESNLKIKQLVINRYVISGTNLEIVREQRKFQLKIKLANFFLHTTILICVLFSMGLVGLAAYTLIPLPFLKEMADFQTRQPILALGGVVVLTMLALALPVLLGELVGSLLSFSLLKRLLPSTTIGIIFKSQSYSTKFIKRVVDKLVIHS